MKTKNYCLYTVFNHACQVLNVYAFKRGNRK